MGRPNLIERRLERFLQDPVSVRNAAGVIVVATTAVVIGAGVLIRLIDPDEYPDIGTGMWWALQTVTFGIALSAPMPHARGALLGGLTGLVVAAAGSGGPSGVARRVALVSAAASLVLTCGRVRHRHAPRVGGARDGGRGVGDLARRRESEAPAPAPT